MTVETAMPGVFDAGLPTLSYDVTETPREVYPRIRDARQPNPRRVGPAPWKPMLGMSWPTSLPIEFG